MKKEMVLLSEKGKKVSIKTEVALSSMKPFGKWPVEYAEEASKRKYEVIGTNIETEYEEMDPECYIIAMYNCIGIGTQNRQTSVNFQ